MHALIHNPLSRFIAQAVVIIACSRLVGLLARRFGQPMVIAEIVAGIMLGPSLLGWLAPGFSAVLFARDSLPLLNMVSQVGLIMFMFLIGLELDPKLLRGRGHTSVVISHASIIAPFALGALLAPYLYPRLAPAGVRFSSFTLFMGVAMSITAFPVLARILSERGLLRSKVGAVAITCAAVDDVTAWCLLAFVVAIVRATGLAGAAQTTAWALVYIAAMFWGMRPFLQRLGARAANRDGLTQNVVAATLVMLLLSCWATELIGIHALFGAFMFGAMMPKGGGFAHALAEKLEDFVLVFMLPLFFAYSGLRTHVGLLASGESWLMCALIVVVACAGKFGGSALAARLTGLRWREASALGILMNTRGLMELIALNIGLDLGVISPTLFTMMVLMALVTTFMTTPLLQWVYPREELARELIDDAEPDDVAATTAAPAPALPATAPGTPAAASTGPRLSDRPPGLLPTDAFTVLMCVSFERSGPAMVTLADALARGGRGGRAKLYALRLVRPTDRASYYVQSGEAPPEGAALAPLLDRAGALGAAVRPLSFVSPDPGQDICNVAEVKDADLVLLGWHKPLLGQSTLGGTVYDVMRDARTDVGVLVDRGLTQVQRVLVPYQGTAHDLAALRLARRLQRAGAEVTILHVTAPAPRAKGAAGSAREQLHRFLESGEGQDAGPVTLKVVEHDSPVTAALAESENGYDLVLVGVGHEWGLEQRVFGIQPETLVRRCPVSLLVMRRYEPARATTAAGAPARDGGGAAPGAAALATGLAATSERT